MATEKNDRNLTPHHPPYELYKTDTYIKFLLIQTNLFTSRHVCLLLHVLIKNIMMMIIIILSDIIQQFKKLTCIFTGINRTLLPWKKKKCKNNSLYIMSVYQFVAFDTLFMYLFIYSFSILFYLLRQPWRNWYRVALVIGKSRVWIPQRLKRTGFRR